MMAKPLREKIVEQICPNEGRAYRAWLKRNLKRRRRRQEKANPETAPTKNAYRGYST